MKQRHCVFAGCALLLSALINACAVVDTKPDPALIESCKLGIADVQKSLDEAQQKDLTTASAYIHSSRLLTKAKLNLRNKQYNYCVDRVARARQYMEDLLVKGKDL